MKQKREFKKGFTLVELLVVISIIGVLSSVVLAGVTSARDKARKSKIIQIMNSVNAAAYECVGSGAALNSVGTNHSSAGGTSICVGGTAILPDITDTGFKYCGSSNSPTPCGRWAQGSGDTSYVISAYNGAFPNVLAKVVLCGSNFNATNYYGVTTNIFDLSGKVTCVKYNF